MLTSARWLLTLLLVTLIGVYTLSYARPQRWDSADVRRTVIVSEGVFVIATATNTDNPAPADPPGSGPDYEEAMAFRRQSFERINRSTRAAFVDSALNSAIAQLDYNRRSGLWTSRCFDRQSYPLSNSLTCSLALPAIANAFPCLLLWLLQISRWRHKSRLRRGNCPTCNFSRAGLTQDVPCPECGVAS
jgi:hypothetical protein